MMKIPNEPVFMEGAADSLESLADSLILAYLRPLEEDLLAMHTDTPTFQIAVMRSFNTLRDTLMPLPTEHEVYTRPNPSILRYHMVIERLNDVDEPVFWARMSANAVARMRRRMRTEGHALYRYGLDLREVVPGNFDVYIVHPVDTQANTVVGYEEAPQEDASDR